jgi:hypothetical protein
LCTFRSFVVQYFIGPKTFHQVNISSPTSYCHMGTS